MDDDYMVPITEISRMLGIGRTAVSKLGRSGRIRRKRVPNPAGGKAFLYSYDDAVRYSEERYLTRRKPGHYCVTCGLSVGEGVEHCTYCEREMRGESVWYWTQEES